MNGHDIETYTAVAGQYAIYPDAGTGNLSEWLYLALGLCDEAGEVAGKIKKFYRDGVVDEEAVAQELGDVLWYWSRIVDLLPFSPHQIMQMNLEKLGGRASRGTLSGNGDKR